MCTLDLILCLVIYMYIVLNALGASGLFTEDITEKEATMAINRS